MYLSPPNILIEMIKNVLLWGNKYIVFISILYYCNKCYVFITPKHTDRIHIIINLLYECHNKIDLHDPYLNIYLITIYN